MAREKKRLAHRFVITKAVTRWRVLAPSAENVSTMHRVLVPSKEITQVGYQEDSETLEIQFVKGWVYQFFNVPSNGRKSVANQFASPA